MSLYSAMSDADFLRLSEQPLNPVEDALDDPTKQDPSPDLPAQVEGNDDEDDTAEGDE